MGRMILTASNTLVVTVTLFTLILAGLWQVNDAFAVVANFGVDGGIVGNGFLWRTPIQAFHIGLWITVFSAFSLVLLMIHVALRGGNPRRRS